MSHLSSRPAGPEHDDCPHCHAHASVERPSSAWWALHAAAWLYGFGSVYGAILTGPIIIGLIPPLFAGGAFLISFSYARASATPECRECGKMVPHGLVAAPAHRSGAQRRDDRDAVRQHA